MDKKLPSTKTQYSLYQIMFLWAIITIPMGISRFLIIPYAREHWSLNTGIVFWLLMVAGLIWQCVVSMAVLKIELGKLSLANLKDRLWLNHPLDPKTQKASKKKYFWVIPIILFSFLVEESGMLDFIGTWWLATFPDFEPPTYILLNALATPEFEGAWYLLALVIVTGIFNYILGEELFFRGILLPKMNGVFGKFDWVMNGVLFGLYHVHKIENIPAIMIGSIFYAYLNKKYRSFYPSVIIHGIEFFPLFFIVLMVVLGNI